MHGLSLLVRPCDHPCPQAMVLEIRARPPCLAPCVLTAPEPRLKVAQPDRTGLGSAVWFACPGKGHRMISKQTSAFATAVSLGRLVDFPRY
jgi:hypothetical protein